MEHNLGSNMDQSIWAKLATSSFLLAQVWIGLGDRADLHIMSIDKKIK